MERMYNRGKEVTVRKKRCDILGLFLMLLLLLSCGSAQKTAEKAKRAADIRHAVEKPYFTFHATHAYPLGYHSIYLSSYYDVTVTPDTVKVHLPYYGRAYRAPMDPLEGGYRFVSTDFTYRYSLGKRSGNRIAEVWIHDQGRPIMFCFDIWEEGTTRLDVNDSDRQSISFHGNINQEE